MDAQSRVESASTEIVSGRGAPVRPTSVESANASIPDYSVFFRREYTVVARTVNLVVHDEGRAEELTQDAFVQLLRHWKRVSAYDRPDAWVRRVAVRLAIKHVTRERLRARLEFQSAVPTLPPSGELGLLDTLRALSAPQRAAIVLHYYEDLPVDEVARLMGCSQNTAKSHLRRGRDRMRTLLNRPGEGRDED